MIKYDFHPASVARPVAIRPRWIVACVALSILLPLRGLRCGAAESPVTPLRVQTKIRFLPDHGQNLGTLFEVHDDEGRVVAAAGFQGAYNTYARGERYRLHFFAKSQEPLPSATQLPRVNQQTGVYLYDRDDELFARSRYGSDTSFYRWEEALRQWRVDANVATYDTIVAGSPLQVTPRKIQYADTTILEPLDDMSTFAEYYYAAGHLFVHLRGPRHAQASADNNRIAAIPWTPGTSRADWTAAKLLPLRSETEFVYAFGQLHERVVAATNTGGVYLLVDGIWKTLLEPDLKTSYQIYSMLNYYDRLLLGHYPSGELISFDGERLESLPDWPPVMPGVRKAAREAQTMALYAGRLFVGVWPWGELWSYDVSEKRWQLAQRMFGQPTPSDQVTHPYEAETQAVHNVYNIWGQRVTGLIPYRESLFVATSSKGGQNADPKFTFLTDEVLDQYGRIYELRIPGHVSAPLRFTDQTFTIDFNVSSTRMELQFNGQSIASQPIANASLLEQSGLSIQWGKGIFGDTGLAMEQTTCTGATMARAEADQTIAVPADRVGRFRGAYVHMPALVRSGDTVEERERAIDKMLDGFQQHGLQIVMPYVNNSSGAALFPSEVAAGRVYGDGDPIHYLTVQARQRGLRVYPVLCCLVSGHDKPAGILRQHPEWALRDKNGQSLGFISPANRLARDWVTSLAAEVVRRYQPDGIVLDYLRYPNRPVILDGSSVPRLADYQQRRHTLSPEVTAQDFRELELSRLMKQIHDTVQAALPSCKLAIYSWGPHVTKNHPVGQAWHQWSQAGWLDFVNISGYCYPDNYGDKYMAVFRKRLRDSVALNRSVNGRAEVTFCLGVETSHGKIQDASWIQAYQRAAAEEGVAGVAVFTWNTLAPWQALMSWEDAHPSRSS